MSTTMSSLSYPALFPKCPRLHLKFPPNALLFLRNPSNTLAFCSSPTRIQLSKPQIQYTHNLFGFAEKNLGVLRRRKLGFCANAENGEEKSNGSGFEGIEEARRQSTMPERFRHLTKEAPDPPLRWPWYIALVFLVYAWRTVLWELSNWRKAALAVVYFAGYLLKLALALIFHFIGNPVTSLIRCVETALYTIRAFYSSIVTYAPVPELTTIIILASAVLAIAEATVPDSVNSQPYLLTVSGLIGFAAVKDFISEPFFWTLLVGLFAFAQLVKKRDYVSSALPVAAVLAAVGQPWLRVVVIASYTALAISHHSKKISDGKEEGEVAATSRRLPVPLLCVSLAIGIHLAAKWAGYRHLTWMIV
ncbi:hypothetical protein VitviT2T_018072 [Vitis vinifera]|uniref:Embryo defective 1923 n=2 Tax=Vitis vinifera TaxID=29760 RepID=F6HHK0_VITVI|nr:uncharacterized protein LOC100242621 [Vitis vinifera]RVW95115.1 hypothetical protein CK203_025545 [Vitis vinifera]WJZ99648.1 hypothetical protein VitviT2T_018072 [Vitis vinifera]|eukprot:XP_002274325.3 PREDICTED: uncharacterized protein LOC100242621 [Vitis vinifera]